MAQRRDGAGKKTTRQKKVTGEGRWGVTEACIFLRTREPNLPRRGGIRMGNYWRVVFLVFPKDKNGEEK